MPDPTPTAPAVPPDPTVAQQNAQASLDSFNAWAPENIKDAGRDIQNSIDQFGNAATAFQSGDTMGGTAMVMKGIGSLGGVMALVAPPVGAIAAAVLGAITSLISAILEAMKPPSESLEAKLKKIIRIEALNDAQVAMSAGKAEWELAETKIFMLAEQRQRAAKRLAGNETLSPEEKQELETIVAGRSWEYLTQNIGWERHKARISASFAVLAQKRDIPAVEWLALYDITVAYAMRFWLAFESMAGLVGEPPGNQSTASLNDVELFASLRRIVARQMRDDLASVHFEGQNNAQLFQLWYGNANYQPIYQRGGVTGQIKEENKSLGGASTTFAVSPGGTIFSSGTSDTGTPVFFGRGNAPWKQADGCPGCNQVFTTELPEAGKLAVVCLYGSGQKIAAATFDDREGIGEESVRDWTPNASRWSGWTIVDLSSSGYTLLNLAPFRIKEGYAVYALGYHQQRKDLYLLDVRFAGPELLPVNPGISFSVAEVQRELGSDLWRRSLPSHCTISFHASTGEPIVQVGNIVRGLENGSLFEWDLRKYVGLASDAAITQGRMFGDGTFIFTTKQGVFMRCQVDPSRATIWVSDKSLQTTWFWKQSSTQGLGPTTLFQHLAKVAK